MNSSNNSNSNNSCRICNDNDNSNEEKIIDNMKWYNKDEVSNIIGISKPTLDKWVKGNKMGSYKVGRRVLFTEDNIKAFMNSFKRGIDNEQQ